ncbi:MAG: hypothetical protein AB8E15_04780 [Bdellovibrionales bacterium]
MNQSVKINFLMALICASASAGKVYEIPTKFVESGVLKVSYDQEGYGLENIAETKTDLSFLSSNNYFTSKEKCQALKSGDGAYLDSNNFSGLHVFANYYPYHSNDFLENLKIELQNRGIQKPKSKYKNNIVSVKHISILDSTSLKPINLVEGTDYDILVDGFNNKVNLSVLSHRVACDFVLGVFKLKVDWATNFEPRKRTYQDRISRKSLKSLYEVSRQTQSKITTTLGPDQSFGYASFISGVALSNGFLSENIKLDTQNNIDLFLDISKELLSSRNSDLRSLSGADLNRIQSRFRLDVTEDKKIEGGTYAGNSTTRD